MSAFSEAVHSRLNTSLQLRSNHLSTLAVLVKRSGLNPGASAAMVLPVDAWRAGAVGGLPWHEAHDHSPPWGWVNNNLPRSALGPAPLVSLQRCISVAGLVSAAWATGKAQASANSTEWPPKKNREDRRGLEDWGAWNLNMASWCMAHLKSSLKKKKAHRPKNLWA